MILSLPGYGNSDLATQADYLADCCEAVEEWCETLASPPLPFIAARGAQFFVVRLAQKRPDLFSRLMCQGLPWSITPKRTRAMGHMDLTLRRLARDSAFA